VELEMTTTGELGELFPELSDVGAEGMVVHADGRILHANRRFAEIFGFRDPHEAIGTCIHDLVGPSSRAAIVVECVRRDGTPIVIETRSVATEYQGQTARAVTVRDATQGNETEAALQEATERFRLAFEGAPIGMALVATDGRWLQVNPALCEIVGYSADELLTRTFQDITHPDDLEADLDLMYQVLAGEIPSYSMEKRYFHADGDVVWINLSVSLVRDPLGVPLYFVSQIEDVTERRRARAALASAEERFRSLVEFAPEAMVIIDTIGAIALVNRQTEELFGYARGELCGQPVEVLLPERLRHVHAGHRSVYAGDPSVRRMGEGLELLGLRRDGSEFPVEISLSPLETSAGTWVSAAVRDISERKRVEAALLRESANVRLLERVAVAANEAWSVEEAYATTLQAVCAHTGWLVGHVWLAVGDGSDRLVSSGIWHLTDSSRFALFRRATEATFRLPGEGLPGRVLESGRALWVHDRPNSTATRVEVGREVGLCTGFAFPVLVGHEIVAVFEFFGGAGFAPDAQLLEVMANVGTQLGRVVERSRLHEQQQELDAARARFVANAAHELRTPLATMRAVAGLLGTRRAAMTPDEIDDCFDMLERQGENLEALVNDLLDLSRLEHGDMAVDAQMVSVDEWMATALDVAPPPEEVTVDVRLAPGLAVFGNKERLVRVLVNLLTNAYRYGGRSLGVSACREGDEAVIEVADDGHGVHESVVGQLFEPFARGPWGGERGAGLGLAISRRIVERFGGRISYTGGEGEGAHFVVRLPLAS
jgi:PAS domain S-box-containing protein